jgi:hypothetical protein
MRLKFVAVLASVTVVTLVLGTQPVGADVNGANGGGTSGDRSVTVSQAGNRHEAPTSGGGTNGGGNSNGGPSATCWSEVGVSADVILGPLQFAPSTHETFLYPVDPSGKSRWQVMHCLYPDGHWVNEVTRIAVDPAAGTAPTPLPTLSPAQLALRATARLHLEFPPLHLSPPGTRTVVGFPTWIWIDLGRWRPVTVADDDGGLSVTLTASPVDLIFDPGDGSMPVHCNGPGTPYRRGIDDPWATSPTCGHTFTTPDRSRTGGRTETTATVTWRFTWQGSDGSTGTLPDLRLVHHQDLAVRAYTAVTD